MALDGHRTAATGTGRRLSCVEITLRKVHSVWQQALALVGNYTVAEEIVSETLLALVRSISNLDANAVQLQPWLRGVVRHKVADYSRQKSKQTRIQAAKQSAAVHETKLNSASKTAEAEEDRLQVLAVLSQLPGSQQLMLEWKHVDGLSIREISERAGQTEKSVESTLYRARK